MNHEEYVRMDNVGRIYLKKAQPVKALVSASCRIFTGDRIAVMGPSGSGKSTLLHLMGGLDFPSSGTVDWPALREEDALRPVYIGFVFQMPSLLPPLDVIENVQLPLLLTGTEEHDAYVASVEMLERLELKGLMNKLPEEISGGQLQRVALARALVCKPRLILADEPTGQLDHPTAKHLFDVLMRVIDPDTALVVATHDAAIADRMNETWSIRHGRLKARNELWS